MISAQQVAELYARRRLAAGPDLARMQEVQQMVNGDIVVALPELNKVEKNSVPNRAREGLKQFSQRIASAMPNLTCPPTRYGFDTAMRRAHDRRKAILGWWAYSKMDIVLRQRARYLQAYASTPVEISWDTDNGVPRYEAINPLYAYPSMLRGPWEMCPHDCIFESSRPLRWLQDNYPLAALLIFKGNLDKPDPDKPYTILKYADAEECVLVALGSRDHDNYNTPPPGSMAVELERYENRSGRSPIVYPRQICLDRLQGQFDGIAGMHQTEATLTALSIQATRKGVWKEPWLTSADGVNEPVIVDVPHLGPDGNMSPGIVKGGSITFEGVDPQFQSNLTIDRLAASQNETAGITSELQGNAGTNIRTGARAQVLLSNVIDFPIQEGQKLLQESLQEENRIAIAFTKAYSGPKSFYVRWDGARGPVTYDPETTFETDENIVEYPLAGADQAGLVISAGQRVGMGTMSKRKFMEVDPLIGDAELEHDRIIAEHLEDLGVQALGQMVAAQAIDFTHLARIAELVESDKQEFFSAVMTARDEAQKAQAQQAPPNAPETQPGLNAPPQPQGAQQPSAENLATILSGLRRPQTGVTPQEQVVA